jgi:DNA-binding NarL/FixJ family response regulator
MGSEGNGGRRIDVALGKFTVLTGHGLRAVLQEDRALRIIGTDLDGPKLERVVDQAAPRVVVLDETSVAELTVPKRLKAIRPKVGIVVLTHQPTRAVGAHLLTAGATCLPDDAGVADILATIHLAADGKHMLGPLADLPIRRRRLIGIDTLTRREAEVLERLRLEQPNAEIAHALGISVETVRTHVASVRRKLRVQRKSELAGVPTASQNDTE